MYACTYACVYMYVCIHTYLHSNRLQFKPNPITCESLSLGELQWQQNRKKTVSKPARAVTKPKCSIKKCPI